VTAELRRAIERYEESEGVHRALAAEQAALRRIATLVAGEPEPGRVFEKVTEEVGRRLGVTTAFVLRYDEEGGSAVLVGAWSERGVLRFPVGSALPLDGDSVIAHVWRSREPERLESYDHAEGELADKLRSMGYRSSIGAPVKVGGRLWGVLVASSEHGPFPQGAERYLCDFADLVAQALANADAHEQLAASRARIVQAADAERRRLERNLHDGAQQRLVSLAVQLRLVEGRIESDPALSRDLLQVAKDELDEALEDLRELARGIHPAILTDRGLGPALETLIARCPAPVEVLALPEQRLPEHVEAAAYYMVAEALTNVAKYAQAQNVRVRVAHEDGHALVEVRDDGIGGADTANGSGLAGLADRVEALGGTLGIESPRGAGTWLRARIPTRA
jgi:signal transduction histidine kinase